MKTTQTKKVKTVNLKSIVNKLQDIETALYYYNSKNVSLNFIGLKKQVTEKDILFLNDFLGQRIKDLREAKELLQELSEKKETAIVEEKMISEKEIKQKLEDLKAEAMISIKKRYPLHGKFSIHCCSPRIYSKIITLEWVLKERKNI